MSRDDYAGLAGIYDPATAVALDPVRRLTCDVLLGLGAHHVLDVCCGTGRQTLWLRRVGIAAVGIDASPAMLTVARRAVRNPTPPFCRMDARRLAFADATFDAAVIMLALHENDEDDRLAMGHEMLRVVRPDGHLLVIDYAAPLAPSPMGLAVAVVERLAGGRHYRNYREFLLKKGVAGYLQRLGRSAQASYPCLGRRAQLAVVPARPASA